MITSEQYRQIPRLDQRQDSTSAQLIDLISVANRLGMHDAADFINAHLDKMSNQKIIPIPLVDENGKLIESMIKLDGKPFRCECGCNVFHRPDRDAPEIYQCNCCDNTFEGY